MTKLSQITYIFRKWKPIGEKIMKKIAREYHMQHMVCQFHMELIEKKTKKPCHSSFRGQVPKTFFRWTQYL